MKIAVIEWAPDDVESPAVYVGTEEEVLRASAVAMFLRLHEDDPLDVLGEVGGPSDLDVEGLWHWQQVVHEGYTAPWVTFYDLDGDDDVHVEPDNRMNRRLLGVLS